MESNTALVAWILWPDIYWRSVVFSCRNLFTELTELCSLNLNSLNRASSNVILWTLLQMYHILYKINTLHNIPYVLQLSFFQINSSILVIDINYTISVLFSWQKLWAPFTWLTRMKMADCQRRSWMTPPFWSVWILQPRSWTPGGRRPISTVSQISKHKAQISSYNNLFIMYLHK